MKRSIVVLALVAVVVSGCSFVSPDPPDVTDVSARLHATAATNEGGELVYWFEYGTTTDYGSRTPDRTVTFPESDDVQTKPVSADISGLEPDTTYHWRACSSTTNPPESHECFARDGTFTTGPAQPHRYIAMGDSLTQVGDPQRYPERLFSFLDDAGIADQLNNIGVSGATSGSLNGAQLTSALALIDDPDTYTTLVTIDIGGNDFLGNSNCLPTSPTFNLTACQPVLAQFASNFDATLDALDDSLADDPGVDRLIVMAYANPWSGRAGQEQAAENAELGLLGTDRKIDCDATGEAIGLNDRIACIGAEHGAELADPYAAFVGHGTIGDYYSDEVHPNGAGHQVLAETLEDVLSPGGG